MAFTTKASRITYKIFPSASSTNPDTLFSTADGWAKVNANGYSQSFLNYPGDTYTGFTTVTGTTTYPTTRVTSSTYPTISVAFPWGSMAGDFLWNCLTPSWSYQTTSGYHTWSYTQTSESFNYRNDRNGTSFGTRLYNITSSWEIYNRKLYANDAITPVTFSFEANQTSTYPVPDISNYTYALDYPTGELVEYGFFDQSGGIGITKAAVSNSMESQSIGLTPAARFEGLKKRRLFFPIPYSGSGATATDYWLKKYSGLNANDFFDENGGIYNVTFTIKKDASLYHGHGYIPNSMESITDIYPYTNYTMESTDLARCWIIPHCNGCGTWYCGIWSHTRKIRWSKQWWSTSTIKQTRALLEPDAVSQLLETNTGIPYKLPISPVRMVLFVPPTKACSV